MAGLAQARAREIPVQLQSKHVNSISTPAAPTVLPGTRPCPCPCPHLAHGRVLRRHRGYGGRDGVVRPGGHLLRQYGIQHVLHAVGGARLQRDADGIGLRASGRRAGGLLGTGRRGVGGRSYVLCGLGWGGLAT